jgi:hypothetical protein
MTDITTDPEFRVLRNAVITVMDREQRQEVDIEEIAELHNTTIHAYHVPILRKYCWDFVTNKQSKEAEKERRSQLAQQTAEPFRELAAEVQDKIRDIGAALEEIQEMHSRLIMMTMKFGAENTDD